MSFREKSAWVSLITYIARVWRATFSSLWQAWSLDESFWRKGWSIGLIVGAVVAFMIVSDRAQRRASLSSLPKKPPHPLMSARR
jgi:ABC-type enterobactin transport system permease subunit